VDRFNRKRREILLYGIKGEDYITEAQIRRKTRAALKKELPRVKSEGTPINEVLDDYYNMET
jgi:biotin operon repressor